MDNIEFGDCREIMRKWKQENIKIQSCITSPPYFGLRDYGHDGQIGLEKTPNEYISSLVEVFRCVKDILADDGTLWLNIGDSYASFRDGKVIPDSSRGDNKSTSVDKGLAKNRMSSTFNGTDIKHKDLIGIPWMLAFALRADGWYLRQDIIWHKPNPMPESVKDRCTKCHEYIFLLSKSDRYYFDYESIKEASTYTDNRHGKGTIRYNGKRTSGDTKANGQRAFATVNDKRNKRSIWTVTTKPYKGAHFATYPMDLIEPCILAGSKKGDIVLDPFMGSGTTAAAAIKHGRHYLGCELNQSYKPLQVERLSKQQTLLL